MKSRIVLLVALLVVPMLLHAQTTTTKYDEIAPYSEGLAAVRNGEQWGFIDKDGTLVIDFRTDLVWTRNADTTILGVLGIQYPIFKNNRCMIVEHKVGDIPFYGFIDKSGEVVIQPEYLNITPFDQEHAIGIYVREAFQGKNEIEIDLIKYYFTEVVLDTSGEIIYPIVEREHILTSKRRYEIPKLRAKLITKDLLAVLTKDNTWETKKLKLAF